MQRSREERLARFHTASRRTKDRWSSQKGIVTRRKKGLMPSHSPRGDAETQR